MEHFQVCVHSCILISAFIYKNIMFWDQAFILDYKVLYLTLGILFSLLSILLRLQYSYAKQYYSNNSRDFFIKYFKKSVIKYNFGRISIFFSNNIKKKFFLMWTIFKVSLLSLLQGCFWFMLWVFWLWDLSSSTRDPPCTPCTGRQGLNHWTAREIPPIGQTLYFWYKCLS